MLMYDDKDLNIPWKGLFVGLGKKYLSENSSIMPKYFVRCYFEATDANGISYTGISNPSSKIMLAQIGADYKVGIDTEKQDLPNDKWIHLFVKDSSRQLIGEVKLRRESEIGEIDIISYDDNNVPQSYIKLNKDGDVELFGGSNISGDEARIKLKKTGEIEMIGKLDDASKKTSVSLNENGKVKIAVANNDVMIIEPGKVTIEGDLEVNRVSYIPYENYTYYNRQWLERT
jgi:hypothetical protein